MPRLVNGNPKYRHHKPSGRAVVTLNGRDFYLGPWNSQQSRAEYDKLIARWILNGRRPFDFQTEAEPLVAELAVDYLEFALSYYIDRKTGQHTRSIDRVQTVVKILRETYGDTNAAQFGPLALQSIQQGLVEQGMSRRYVNHLTEVIKRVFKWGVSRERIPAAVYQALATVPGLRKGRTDAREPAPVLPVADEVIEATLPHLPAIVADMVCLQRLTGARPGEICHMRPVDVDRSGEIWAYRPESHKTAHRGRQRVIFIGPRAQEILRPYLLRDAEAFCFSPRESSEQFRAAKRAARKTPLTPSQAKRRPKRKPKKAPGECYTVPSYGRAIDRAADKAFGKVCGPLPAAKLLQLIEFGELGESDVVRHGNRGLWKSVKASAKLLAAAEAQPAAKGRRAAAAPAVGQADGWFYMTTAHRWAPNQLRHSAGTEIRKRFGLEAAQVALGHSRADVTQIYAERDFSRAELIAREVG